MFLENSKYKLWIVHKKLVYDEIVTVFHISIHISLNIGPRILNPYTPEYPFPSAVHIYVILTRTYRSTHRIVGKTQRGLGEGGGVEWKKL